MRTRSLLGLLCFSSIGICQGASGPKQPRGWTADWKTEQLVLGSVGGEEVEEAEGCTVSRVQRYDVARGRSAAAGVFFSTSAGDDFERPSIEPMNGTAGEQWEFDGISEDGAQAFCFGFYRDPNYAMFGSGNLRLYAEFGFPNGSRYAVVDYAEESVVESCPGRGTRGVWRAGGWSYSFEVSADMSRTRIVMDNPEAKGTIVMTSVAPPRYADANVWPSEDASSLTVPHFYWVEPVPVADLTIDAVINGETIAWTGMGGHERLWGAFNWYTCLDSMVVVRLRAGPYALSFIDFGSGREKGLHVPSVMLAEGGKKIFGTRRTEPSKTEDYFQVRKLYGGDGATTVAIADKVTGVEVVLESPGRKKQWKFVVTHKNVAFEYFLGQGVGGTAYSGTLEGGLVGSKQFKGPAFTEIMKFPEKSMLLKRNYIE
ncbi:hypothetical protein F4779DRAFT_366326 [Xylariaceae sp. FL0662B]|nr:hypothetical protein F4779DRAFT_366326 [Xylariaceae sp. FL0662B]